MKKKRILFVTHHLTVGGVQKSLISALNAIDYERNDVTLYVRKNRRDLLPYINRNVSIVINDDKTHYYRKIRSLWYQIGIVFFRLFGNQKREKENEEILAKYIRACQMEYEHNKYFGSEHYDVAIAYVQGYTAQFVAEMVSASKKVMFYQGSTDECHDIHEKVLPLIDCVAVEHEDVKKLILQWYPGLIDEKQIVILANYTDKELLLQQGKEIKLENHEGKTVLCTCARMAPVKGIDLAVNSAKILRERNHSFVWYFVGDGPESPKIKKMVEELNLGEYVFLTGMQKNPYPYMLNCDVYVQPSREEALSIAMLESQLLEKPMVSTKTVGGISMIEDGFNGILTQIDAESLAMGIEKLITDISLRCCIANHLKQVDYSMEKKRYQGDWQKLLEG